jgi:hypothetical protein
MELALLNACGSPELKKEDLLHVMSHYNITCYVTICKMESKEDQTEILKHTHIHTMLLEEMLST